MSDQTWFLPTISTMGLRALADGMLAQRNQLQLADLLAGNAEGKLTEQESRQLDSLIEQLDALNLLKARADYTLRHKTREGNS